MNLPSGTVKSWNEEQGFGFIAPDGGGEDVFVHRSVLSDGQSLIVGSPVIYEAEFDAEKNAQRAKRCAGAVERQAGTGGPIGGADGTAVGQIVEQAGDPAGLAALMTAASGKIVGTVKHWYEDKGFGFVIPDIGGEDVFVHRTSLLDGDSLSPGGKVSYESFFDQAKGKMMAKNVSGANPKGAGKGTPAPGGGGGAMMMAAGQMKPGKVKAWYEEKGFGFIVPDGGGEDVFIHKKELIDSQTLWQDAPVLFEANWDPAKNKYKATKCMLATSGGQLGGGMMIGGFGPAVSSGAGIGRSMPEGDNLFVAGFPVDTTEEAVKNIFGAYGVVLSVKVLPANGKPDMAALVRMQDRQMAKWLVDNLNGNMPVGLSTPITVRYAQSGNGGVPSASRGMQAPMAGPYGTMGLGQVGLGQAALGQVAGLDHMAGLGGMGMAGIAGGHMAGGLAGLHGVGGITGIPGIGGYGGVAGFTSMTGAAGLQAAAAMPGVAGVAGVGGVSAIHGMAGVAGMAMGDPNMAALQAAQFHQFAAQ
eukprot:TRINITY_DN104190_c0_g1_i1.p1 TRINITY_DN104190_c0_g1~~TRINITY_DN104190_c0_g1_i1.p1  ORF type:complete len:529 (+),score=121.88 TRINITY_DN104190_c0_g1_i1:95-1681(+)